MEKEERRGEGTMGTVAPQGAIYDLARGSCTISINSPAVLGFVAKEAKRRWRPCSGQWRNSRIILDKVR
jgi:hypothetical protein